MRSGSARSTNLRAKVVALLLSLVALWSFAAWVTLREGVNLLFVQAIDSQIVGPSEPLLLELQVERRLSAAQLGGPSPDRANALAVGRRQVDDAAVKFRATAQSRLARFAGSAEAERTVEAAFAALDTLPATRQAIDGRTIDQTAARQAYTGLVDALFELYDVVGGLDDPEIEADTRSLIELYRIRELISQEDALLSGALAAGRSTTSVNSQLTELVAAQRYLAQRALGTLRESERAKFDQVIGGPAFNELRRTEDRLLARERAATALPLTSKEWDSTAGAALSELQTMVLSSGDALVDRATPVAVWVVVRLVLAAGLGALAVIASIVMSVTTARALVAQLQLLRVAAHQLADERLPSVVRRLGRGEKVDVAAEAPPLDFGDDEIGQLGQAFNRVQEMAILTAVRQAELRRDVRDVFLSLARRTQGLVHRQLTLLERMQRNEEDPKKLEDLFRVDHLTTRQRRNAENLIVLSGATPGRAWRQEVPLLDVARAASQEVEDYTRVNVLPFGSVGLAGRAVGDVIHLLAELIENALSFSPPHTTVDVSGQLVAKGFVVEVVDRGLGMGDEELVAANEQIASTEELGLPTAKKLGLYVVRQLSQKHGITVRLKDSGYGGTTAVVLIPMALITVADPPTVGTGPGRAGPLAVAGVGDTQGGRLQAATPAGAAVALADPLDRTAIESATTAAVDPAAPEGSARVDDQTEATSQPPTPSGERTGVNQEPSSSDALTRGGLPVRQRQRRVVPPLRDVAVDEPSEGNVNRTPELIRSRMSDYQQGSLRGREAAARGQDDGGSVGPVEAPNPAETDL
ncbi:nitrate- and nitrite sensing domain-containing protein [Micromonospora sp. NPDC005710]|uniref:sensor histidine kinase n=1 Tax=Micromonospora sp. NPDC005710 TaxID=3157051 RepID=UPI0033D97F94